MGSDSDGASPNPQEQLDFQLHFRGGQKADGHIERLSKSLPATVESFLAQLNDLTAANFLCEDVSEIILLLEV